MGVAPHPEDRCDRCGCPNVVWFAPSPIWNTAIAGTNYDILCPVCFIVIAEKAGIRPTGWKLEPEVISDSDRRKGERRLGVASKSLWDRRERRKP